jgi:hypothetical protein
MIARSRPNHFFPGGTIGEALQFAQSVDIKNKDTVVVKMSGHSIKDFPPMGWAQQMIDRIKHTNDRIKTSRNTEASHVLAKEPHVRKLFPSDRQHGAGSVQPGNLVRLRQQP